MSKQKKKGISLVALVITIIVLIILTGTVISTFMEGGIIDRAKEAVKRSDAKTLQEAYDTKYNTKKIEIETGIGGIVDKADILKQTVKEVGMEKDFKYNAEEGMKVVYVGDNEYIEEWLKEVLVQLETEKFLMGNGYLISNAIGSLITVEDIKAELGNEYKIYDGDQEVTTGTVTTGYKVKNITTGEENIIVVKGDITKDKFVRINDATIISSILTGGNVEVDVILCSADVNCDGVVSKDDSEIVLLFCTGLASTNKITLPIKNHEKINEKVYSFFEEETLIKELSKVGKNVKCTAIDEYKIELSEEITFEGLANRVKEKLNLYDIELIDCLVDKENNEDYVQVSKDTIISGTGWIGIKMIVNTGNVIIKSDEIFIGAEIK